MSEEAPSSNGARRRVLVWIEAARAYGRGCLLGIAGYARNHGAWHLVHVNHRPGQDIPEYFAELRVEGVLSRMDNQAAADRLAELGVPVVDLRGVVKPPRGLSLDTDHNAVGAMAVEHFVNHGFQNMAYCGYAGVNWSERRCEAFVAEARKLGIDPPVFMLETTRTDEGDIRAAAMGEHDNEQFNAWLRDLPKPIAIFACNDDRGRQIVAACRELDIAVPEEIAVLGVDNDTVVCELSEPPLSSIEPDTYRIGYRGAATLERFMEDPALAQSGQVELIKPRKVVARLSTDVTAIEDAIVARSMRMIRECGGNGINVATLADSVSVSRTTLERRFRDAIGRSPRQEIDRIRMDHARSLVRETDYPLHKIAAAIGYSNASRLLGAYKRRYGVTPGVDRQRASLARH